MTGTAQLSDDGLYRYRLTRTWGDRYWQRALFIMLNPSTADADLDDPTIRRCIRFAQREACAGLVVVNLYAFRTPSPANLRESERDAGVDVVGPHNDGHIRSALLEAAYTGSPIIAAWGANTHDPARVDTVRQLLGSVRTYCLGTTRNGSPRHPLYVRADTPLQPFPTTESHRVPTVSPPPRDTVA